jgi:hypothetical protein
MPAQQQAGCVGRQFNKPQFNIHTLKNIFMPDQIEQAKQSIQEEIRRIDDEASRLKRHGRKMHFYHQLFTVSTILLGVSAPALVTYTPHVSFVDTWKFIAIVITAFATASATIRSVLRFGERYSNSELASLELFKLKNKTQGKMNDISLTVKEDFVASKLSELSTWASDQMFDIVRSYAEREVAAITKDKIQLTEPPQIRPDEKIDPTKK